MSVPSVLPAPIPLRDLVLAAISDLVAGDGGSPTLRELLAQMRARGLGAGEWARRLTPALREPHPDDRPLAFIARALRLSPIEQLTLALVMAVDEDPLLGRVLAELQHPVAASRPTLGFVAVAFGAAASDERPMQALYTGPALASGLMTLSRDDRPLGERTLSLSPPLSLALRGYDGRWPGAEIGRGALPDVPLPASVAAQAQQYGRAMLARERFLVLRTGSPAEGRAVASAIAAISGRRAVFLDGESLDGLAAWLLLRNLMPVFCFELGPGERKALPPLPWYDGPVLVVTGPDGSVDAAGTCAPDWTLGVPPPAERAALWASALGPSELALELAAAHRHGAGRIAQLGRLAKHRALLDGAEIPTRAHVHAAGWIDDGPGLGGLAQPLRDPVADQALVTTPTLRTELEHLLLRCQARDGLDEGLGASLRARYRPGVRALFVGPSGTGKTLAAGWLATRLGVPLYRVDLAAVTSKYIGETEKNLAQVLARAEHAEVVLLFDEADSMFGKRTDVKEANDRFANAQTNYLLQRIESFDGITILTSNSRSRFDTAFARRLDAILDFALPGPDERRGLWLSHLGEGHALAPRTINKLAATVDLTGGHIRNVVLTAAVLAHAHRRQIEYADILAGLVSELRKLGRQVPHELRTPE